MFLKGKVFQFVAYGLVVLIFVVAIVTSFEVLLNDLSHNKVNSSLDNKQTATSTPERIINQVSNSVQQVINEYEVCTSTPSDTALQKVVLPENIFNSEVNIPGTNIVINYPSKGFYELGAKVFYRNNPGKSTYALGADKNVVGKSVGIQTTEQYNFEKKSEYVILEAEFVRTLINEETFRTFIDSHVKKIFSDNYSGNVISSGYEQINGNNYFILKSAEDVTDLGAYGEIGGNVYHINLAYKSGLCPESFVAYKNNDKLFREILGRIQLKQ